ncbi:hypothetical protein ADUPG1_010354 [Aduncisulcus paluster]|uniref:Uncharacterized protein n=1 Tax=Aduncisulcus paluster TaxID=2918883 RepID=A0ABQ5JR23_9EUKA|nr:hypothetical protein ADUPG1_010354 [Aduncisulcus paluster]
MPTQRELTNRELAEYTADICERILKVVEPKGFLRAAQQIEGALLWREHDGAKIVDDAIKKQIDDGKTTLTITELKIIVKDEIKKNLEEEGDEKAEEHSRVFIQFLKFTLSNRLRHNPQLRSPRSTASQLRHDDSFVFIPRTETANPTSQSE